MFKRLRLFIEERQLASNRRVHLRFLQGKVSALQISGAFFADQADWTVKNHNSHRSVSIHGLQFKRGARSQQIAYGRPNWPLPFLLASQATLAKRNQDICIQLIQFLL